MICDFCDKDRHEDDGRHNDAGFECYECMEDEAAYWADLYYGTGREAYEPGHYKAWHCDRLAR